MPEINPPFLPPVPNPLTSNDKLLVILCHLSLILGVGFILPLIVFLVKREDSPLVAAHAKEVLNFHISLVIYVFVSFALMLILIGFLLFFAVILGSFICAIIAAIRASEGEFYRYPLTIRLIS
jgi:uncharacterized Tic20 family protein